MEHYLLFPSLVSMIECENFHAIKSRLINWIYEYQKVDEGRSISNIGGWQSSKNFREEESFGEYLEYIQNHVNKLCNDTLKSSVYIYDLWININQKHDFNWQHVHPETHLSGVFWIKSPENCGKLIFESPQSFSDWKIYKNLKQDYVDQYFLQESACFSSKEGSMMIFPPNLRHGVTPNLSNEDRISMAFNLKIDS